jgi:hypothetical protein
MRPRLRRRRRERFRQDEKARREDWVDLAFFVGLLARLKLGERGAKCVKGEWKELKIGNGKSEK